MSIKATLKAPSEVWVNFQPPVPAKIPVHISVAAILENTDTQPTNLFAPTPCDVHYWEIQDANGVVVFSEPAEICIQVIAETLLPAGQALRGDNIIEINGKHLQDGSQYTIKYTFWGQACQAAFTARYAQ